MVAIAVAAVVMSRIPREWIVPRTLIEESDPFDASNMFDERVQYYAWIDGTLDDLEAGREPRQVHRDFLASALRNQVANRLGRPEAEVTDDEVIAEARRDPDVLRPPPKYSRRRRTRSPP